MKDTFTLPMAKAERIRRALESMCRRARENAHDYEFLPSYVKAVVKDDLDAWTDCLRLFNEATEYQDDNDPARRV
jgi:hypothetical protein